MRNTSSIVYQMYVYTNEFPEMITRHNRLKLRPSTYTLVSNYTTSLLLVTKYTTEWGK